MRWYAFLLYPFAAVYDLITKLRNLFFDLGWKKSQKSLIPSIVIGNLSVGGTGKTPMVEFLIRSLQKDWQVAVLSRGYGRKAKGFLTAEPNIDPSELGDEPYQIYKKFGHKIPVFVGEDRVAAIKNIINKEDVPELLILDDAFQHRYVSPDLNILLTTFDRPFYWDFLLPMGRLRESRAGAKRADILIVTKSPEDLPPVTRSKITVLAKKHLSYHCPVIFSSVQYASPYSLGGTHQFTNHIILLSGLADDSSLVRYVSKKFRLLQTLAYPDHHDYSDSDFRQIRKIFESHLSANPILLTTEKDAVKVKSFAPEGFLQEIPIFVLPITISMSQADTEILENLIRQKVHKKRP